MATDLTEDSSVTLITAPPGSGKSLRLVSYIHEELAKGGPTFVCNVNGLIDTGEFAGWIPFPDPTQWMTLPAGSTLVVDEAQDFFRPNGKATLPEYLTEMERIRHYGVRLVLASQHSSFLHPHILKLVTKHEHLVRENGAKSSTIYKRSRVIANTGSDSALAKEDHQSWAHPEKFYDAYKSAQVHTVKRTIKAKYKRGIVLMVIAAVLVGFVLWKMRGVDDVPETKNAGTPSAQAVGSSAFTSKENKPKYASPADYAKAHLPRIGMMPWTAPVFDDREPTADPIIVCASSLPGEGANGEWMEATCTCFTEQGTLYDLGQPECRTIARRGPVYNPYKERRSEGVQGPSPAAMAATAAAPSVGSVIQGDIKTVGSQVDQTPRAAP